MLATVLFWAIPLFQPHATIHWDLADVTYPAQKYFAASVHAGRLPYWTPYLYSGMPFLSDPQTGAWYPLHWPFYLIGITPRILFWELALHSFLALAGAFLLARKLFGDPVAAAIAAMFYAWGGFFAAHSSQLGKFEAAALLPWLLWASLLERRMLAAHRDIRRAHRAGRRFRCGAVLLPGVRMFSDCIAVVEACGATGCGHAGHRILPERGRDPAVA